MEFVLAFRLRLLRCRRAPRAIFARSASHPGAPHKDNVMYYEPDTVWGRTIEGDEEVSVPRSGLSLVQRRVLRELAQPRTFASIAAKHKIEAPKLENELIWLAERKLVAFQRPGAASPRKAARIHPADP